MTLPGGRRSPSRAAAQTPLPVRAIEAVGATVHAGEGVVRRQGLVDRFFGVSRDNRCPADLPCFVAGSADGILAFSQVDEHRNTQASDRMVEFSRKHNILVSNTDDAAIVADLSGDSAVAAADRVLSLDLVVVAGVTA